MTTQEFASFYHIKNMMDNYYKNENLIKIDYDVQVDNDNILNLLICEVNGLTQICNYKI